MRIVIIVQARMSSTRLPGKVLKKIMGKPLLEYQIERLRRVESADDLIVATTTGAADDALVSFCESRQVGWFRGDEEDVLSRYHQACEKYRGDAVVRVTADCPLIDPDVVNQVIDTYLDAGDNWDYVANTIERTYPRGMDCEVFSAEILASAHREARAQSEREHVTEFFYRRPERFRLLNVSYPTDQSAHRWTVDTPEDLELIGRMLETLYPQKPEFTLEDCLELASRHPELSEINRHIKQKSDEDH